MHVAFLMGQLHSGGIQKAIYQICSSPAFSSYKKSAISLTRSQGEMTPDFLSLGFSLYQCRILIHNLPERPYRAWKFYKQAYKLLGAVPLYRLLMKIKPDIIHSHICYDGLAPQLLAAYWSQIPIILTLQGSFKLSELDRLVLSSLLPRFSSARLLFTSVSKALGTDLEFVDQERIQTIGNPVDLEVFTTNHVDSDRIKATKQTFAIDQNSMVVGSIGRLEPEKGYDVLIKAVPLVLKNFPRTQFVIVGEGKCRTDLDLLVKELKVQDWVRLVGLRQDIPDLLKLFDIYVQPSRSEGQPLAITEAMATGVPVVASAVGGLKDLLLHGTAGLLVSPDNPAELSEQVCSLLADADLRKKLSLQAMTKAKQFDVKVISQQYSDLYGRIASGCIPTDVVAA